MEGIGDGREGVCRFTVRDHFVLCVGWFVLCLFGLGASGSCALPGGGFFSFVGIERIVVKLLRCFEHDVQVFPVRGVAGWSGSVYTYPDIWSGKGDVCCSVGSCRSVGA